jgi:hypothetical protein
LFTFAKITKNMKKSLFVACLVLTTIFANAQKRSSDNKVSFNVGGELALATGDFSSTHSFGIGATAQLNYNLEENIDLIANAGIIAFSGKKIEGTNSKYKGIALIPILVGGKYYFSENFYGQAALGLGIFNGSGSSVNKFSYSPGLGFKINDKLDALVKYTGYTKVGGSFGVRVGYTL